MVKEKRKFARILTKGKLKIRIIEPKELSDLIFTSADLINISGGGILFRSPKEIPAKTILTLSFDLPNTINSLFLLGEVMRTTKINTDYEIAMKFLKTDEKECYAIFDYIVKNIFKKQDD